MKDDLIFHVPPWRLVSRLSLQSSLAFTSIDSLQRAARYHLPDCSTTQRARLTCMHARHATSRPLLLVLSHATGLSSSAQNVCDCTRVLS